MPKKKNRKAASIKGKPKNRRIEVTIIDDPVKKEESVSAARMRSAEVGLRHKKEKVRPPQKYLLGEMVEVPEMFKGKNVKSLVMAGLDVGMKIIGIEWGGDNREHLSQEEVWFYWLSDLPGKAGLTGPAVPIQEYKIIGRVYGK